MVGVVVVEEEEEESLGERGMIHRAHLEQPSLSYSETLFRPSSILVAQVLQMKRSRNLPHRHDFRHSDSKAITQVQYPRPDRDRSWGLLSTETRFVGRIPFSLCHGFEAFEAPRALATMMENVDNYWSRR